MWFDAGPSHLTNRANAVYLLICMMFIILLLLALHSLKNRPKREVFVVVGVCVRLLVDSPSQLICEALFYTIFNWWLNFIGNFMCFISLDCDVRSSELQCWASRAMFSFECNSKLYKNKKCSLNHRGQYSMSLLRRFWLKIYQFILRFVGASHSIACFGVGAQNSAQTLHEVVSIWYNWEKN